MSAQTAYAHKSVTPHDSTNIVGGTCDALWVGVGGDVSVVTSQDEAETYKNVPSGYLLQVKAKRVNATGTTATYIIAQYA